MSLARYALSLPPATEAQVSRLANVQDALNRFDQVDVKTLHLIWDGVYYRTINLDEGVVMLGAVVIVPTVLNIHGSVSILNGDEQVDLEGHNVIAGHPFRQQLFVTRGPVAMTMSFKTNAETFEDAENEAFMNPDELLSRREV